MFSGRVFPTHVGMNRFDDYFTLRRIRIPHACGDEPEIFPIISRCSGVFPTHVGMNRRVMIWAG